jgi:hypothetical protein
MSVLIEDFSAMVVTKIMGKPVTQGMLESAFARVEPKDGPGTPWKNPIDIVAVISDDYDMELVRAAIEHFTGSKATFTFVGPNKYRVKAAGYYATIGA